MKQHDDEYCKNTRYVWLARSYQLQVCLGERSKTLEELFRLEHESNQRDEERLRVWKDRFTGKYGFIDRLLLQNDNLPFEIDDTSAIVMSYFI